MTHAYFNYPKSFVKLHGEPACNQIRKMNKANQRIVYLTPASFHTEMVPFFKNQFDLGAEASKNDLWLFLDFGDAKFEEALARYVCRLLGRRYSPLAPEPVSRHDCT